MGAYTSNNTQCVTQITQPHDDEFDFSWHLAADFNLRVFVRQFYQWYSISRVSLNKPQITPQILQNLSWLKKKNNVNPYLC